MPQHSQDIFGSRTGVPVMARRDGGGRRWEPTDTGSVIAATERAGCSGDTKQRERASCDDTNAVDPLPAEPQSMGAPVVVTGTTRSPSPSGDPAVTKRAARRLFVAGSVVLHVTTLR